MIARKEKAIVKRLGLLSVAIWTAACAAAPLGATPDDAVLDRIEARIAMPAGARPLTSYSRSYFPAANGTKIMGVYSTMAPPGRRWVRQHPGPFIMDGGCAIVTTVIDRATESIEQVECNGVG